MNLAFDVLRYVSRSRARPSDAGDPGLLSMLEKAARDAVEGIAALTAPISPMTWESKALLVGNVQSTNRVNFTFPKPVEVVGFYASVVVLTNTAGLITPSTDVIDVQMDANNENFLTSGTGISSSAGGTGSAGNFVTLSAMTVQVPRLVCYKLRNPTPNMGFTYRWKQDVSGGAVYQNALVSLTMFARYL